MMATAQRDATIKSRRRWRRVATIDIGVQRRIETTARTMTTAPTRIARQECGRLSGDVDDHDDTDAAAFAGGAETTGTTSTATKRRAK